MVFTSILTYADSARFLGNFGILYDCILLYHVGYDTEIFNINP